MVSFLMLLASLLLPTDSEPRPALVGADIHKATVVCTVPLAPRVRREPCDEKCIRKEPGRFT